MRSRPAAGQVDARVLASSRERVAPDALEVRTFYWAARVVGWRGLWLRRLAGRAPSRYFTYGNAGDVFARDIVAARYGAEACNVRSEGRRLLTVGSVAHRLLPEDVVCGIGTKGNPIPSGGDSPALILGLRGPITYEAFSRAGHDLSTLRFLMDPGLLIRYMVDSHELERDGRDVIFIPHYRERYEAARSLPRGIRFVDIDAPALRVASEILKARMVYSSSLHGIIFAHALSRPCVLVRPQTDEPLIKYEDHFAAVGVPFRKPLDSIADARFIRDSDSPASVKFSREDFVFPSAQELIDWGVARTRGARSVKATNWTL